MSPTLATSSLFYFHPFDKEAYTKIEALKGQNDLICFIWPQLRLDSNVTLNTVANKMDGRPKQCLSARAILFCQVLPMHFGTILLTTSAKTY